MAASKVFSIPELLEMILIDLSFKDVLRAARINKTFQSTVQSYPSLQRKLFLRQDSEETDELSIKLERAPSSWLHSRLFSDEESDFEEARSAMGAGQAAPYVQKDATKPALNPMIQHIFNSFSHNTSIRLEKVAKPRTRRFDTPRFHEYRNSRNHKLVYKEGVRYFTWIRIDDCRHGELEALLKGSKFKTKAWRGMYVTNRPCVIVVSIGSWKGEYRCPPNTKIQRLLRNLVKVHRGRFPHRGSGRR